MKTNNIGYHTRLAGDDSVKVCGGSFGGSIDQDTVERLTRLFTVKVKTSGRAVFVDRNGREVSLYISVDPEKTEVGKAAIAEYNKEKEKQEAARMAQEEKEQEELDTLLSGMSHAEIMAKLKALTIETIYRSL
tara:strand:+ start:84537 stop:84935 length:399 start_codon:yes stop_codon:yes gene_type:complete